MMGSRSTVATCFTVVFRIAAGFGAALVEGAALGIFSFSLIGAGFLTADFLATGSATGAATDGGVLAFEIAARALVVLVGGTGGGTAVADFAREDARVAAVPFPAMLIRGEKSKVEY